MQPRLNILALVFVLFASACHSPSPPTSGTLAAAQVATVVLQAPDKAHALPLFVACTEAQRAQGLMHRRSLAPAQGMIFIFPHSAPLAFWMHNTPLSLDLLFFDDLGRLACVIDSAEPNTDTSRSCPVPCSTVVELPAGTASRLHLGPGTVLESAARLAATLCPKS